MSDAKLPRDAATRDQTVRMKQWKPADLLPEPTRTAGWEYRWVRKSIMGNEDPTNMSRSLREGWEPCRLEDHPELMLSVDAGAVNAGLVEVGGLILCKMPIEMWNQRQAYYEGLANGQMESVDANLARENDSRMPLFNERQTKVSFGSGR
jgi:hypothetical protein